MSRAPLKVSSFTLDELEHAIRHSDPDQPVTLIAEVHSSLIYALRALSTHRHLAVLSLLEELDEMDMKEGVATEVLTDALAEIGNNWERQPLRADEGRYGWEEAMVGCIKDVSQRKSCGLSDQSSCTSSSKQLLLHFPHLEVSLRGCCSLRTRQKLLQRIPLLGHQQIFLQPLLHSIALALASAIIHFLPKIRLPSLLSSATRSYLTRKFTLIWRRVKLI